MEGTRKKRKAHILPAALDKAGVGGSAGTAYLDSMTGPRRVNGKIVPRHLIVFHTAEGKVIHLTVEYTVLIRNIIDQIEMFLGYAVTLHQTDKKKKTVVLNPNEIAEDGMHFGYSVQVKRVVPVSVEPTKVVSWRGRLHEISGVLRSVAGPADEKQAKAPPPGDEGGSSSSAPPAKKLRAPPEWAPRGAPGGWLLSQAPIKLDEHGNKLPTEYQNVYWHQGM